MSLHWDAAHRLARQVAQAGSRAEKRAMVRQWATRIKFALEESSAVDLSAGRGNPDAEGIDPPNDRGADPVRREAWSPCSASAPKD